MLKEDKLNHVLHYLSFQINYFNPIMVEHSENNQWNWKQIATVSMSPAPTILIQYSSNIILCRSN